MPEITELQWPLFPEYAPTVSAEQNLEEFPLFELKARKRGTKARIFERTILGEGGVALNQVWKVMPSGEYGMPGPLDQDVYLAVLQLLQQRGGMPEDGELSFSLYELRKILGWSDDSGGAYREVRDTLVRIATTSVQSKNAFYSAEEQRRIVDTFNIWSVHFAEHEIKGHTVKERHVLRFHPVFIRNYMAQYLKGIDSEFYWSLRYALSKRLYRLVDLQRTGGLSWEADLFALRDQVPLDYNYPSQIKRALQKAHAELVERKFLSGVEYEGKTGITYEVSREFARRQKARELSGEPKEIFAIERLIRETIDGETARELVAAHGPEKCIFYSEAVNYQNNVANRPGWIITAIKKGWTVRDATQATLQESFGAESLETTGEDTAPPEEVTQVPQRPSLDPAAQDIFDAVLEDISAEIDTPSCKVWFEGTIPVSLDDKRLTLSVPNAFAEEYIRTRFAQKIEEGLRRKLGDGASLSVTVYG